MASIDFFPRISSLFYLETLTQVSTSQSRKFVVYTQDSLGALFPCPYLLDGWTLFEKEEE